MSFVDGAILTVLLISGLYAFSRGFVLTILSLLSWVLAIIVTLQAFPYLQPIARQHISGELTADAAAALGLFIASMVTLHMVSNAMSRAIRDSSIGALDRSLGFLLGLGLGSVVVCLGYLGLVWLYDDQSLPPSIAEARFTPAVKAGSRILLDLAPDSLMSEAAKVQALGLPDFGGLFERALSSAPDLDLEKGYKSGVVEELEELIRKTKDE